MTQSGIQKSLGTMLLASSATLAIVLLGGEALRLLKGTALLRSPAVETASAPTWDASQHQPHAWAAQANRRPDSNWHDHPQHSSLSQRPRSYPQAQPATMGHSRQVNYVAETNLTANNISPRHDLRTAQEHTYANTNYPSIEYSNLPPTDLQQANVSQPAAPRGAIPSHPSAQKTVRSQSPTMVHSNLETTTARPHEPVLTDRPISDVLQHSELVQETAQQESEKTFNVLQTSFETRIVNPRSQLSAPHMASQIQISKQGIIQPKSELAEEPSPAPAQLTVQQTPAVRSAQHQVLPRQQVNPQVDARAQKRILYGESLSRRRSFHAAREEFILALLLISNSHDTKANAHANRLAQALTAMDEMIDFVSIRNSTGHDQRFQQTVLSHKTPLLIGADLTTISPMKAIDLYCGFAQSQVEQAIGYSTAGSKALHALGKLETMDSSTSPQGSSTSQTKAIVFFRAALSVNPANALCANDLGVLLFNMGRLNEAEETLRLSLGHAQSRMVWRNLASVHKQQASLATSGDQRNQQLRLTMMAETEAQKFQNDPRDQGLADDQWATTSDFQNNAAFPDTVVQRASRSIEGQVQPNSGRVKTVSFLQKITGRD